MNEQNRTLRSGDWVEVRTPQEIERTLDGEGSLDALPFMPEMLQYCGRRFQVITRAEKACVEFPGGGYKIREFRQDDVFLLADLRCSGLNHDGCGRACVLFWKAAWLRRIDAAQARMPAPAKENPAGELLAKIRTTARSGRYFCQSTEMARATQPLSRARILWKCIREVRTGSRGPFEMASLMYMPLWRKLTRWMPRRRLTGNLKRTPVADLALQPGEWVQIRPANEIAKSLDSRGRNRGLSCDYGMCQYRGGKYRVRNRLDQMISEPTGEMRQVQSTVILDGLQCLCWNVFGGCPRRDFMYWREIWLERTGSPDQAGENKTAPVPGERAGKPEMAVQSPCI